MTLLTGVESPSSSRSSGALAAGPKVGALSSSLFLAYVDDREQPDEGWTTTLVSRLAATEGVVDVRSFRLGDRQVQLPGSQDVQHRVLIAATVADVSDAERITASWRDLAVADAAAYVYEVVRPITRAADAPDGRHDCYLAFTNPASDDRIAEFHEWYVSHVPALLRCPGSTARRGFVGWVTAGTVTVLPDSLP